MLIENGPDFENIPLFDLQHFKGEDSQERRQSIIRLREACHHVGFFYIKNHGIHPSLMKRMLTLAKAFFDLSQDEKESVSISPSRHYRGYGKLRAEITEGVPDYKESYDLGLEQAARDAHAEHPYFMLQGPNQWPVSDELQQLHWKETMLEYLSSMQKVGEQLMAAISLTLGFAEDCFANKFSSHSEDAYAMLRLLRYPPGKKIEKHHEPEIGVGPHVDFGCLVLLLQDQVGGLQVQNCRGQWIDAPPLSGTYVVNIGEMLQIWSNNYFLATPHRVINVSSATRYSIPFFFEPNLTTVVTPLDIAPELLASMNRPKVNPRTRITYGQHILNVFKRSFQTTVA